MKIIIAHICDVIPAGDGSHVDLELPSGEIVSVWISGRIKLDTSKPVGLNGQAEPVEHNGQIIRRRDRR